MYMYSITREYYLFRKDRRSFPIPNALGSFPRSIARLLLSKSFRISSIRMYIYLEDYLSIDYARK